MASPVLVARTHFIVDKAAAARVPAWLAGAPASAPLLAQAGTTEWHLSDEFTRSTRLDAKGKPQWTVLLPTGDGVPQFWDHEAGTKLSLGPQAKAEKALPPLQGLQFKLGDGIAWIEFFAPVLGRVRQQLKFSRDKDWPHVQRLLEAVIGCAVCHAASGIPVAELAKLGTLQSVLTWLDDGPEPAFITEVTVVEARKEAAADFKPPAKFKAFALKALSPRPAPRTDRQPAAKPLGGEHAQGPVGVNRQALDASGPQTPECLPSTRLGATALVIRQRLLDHLAAAVNDIAPVLGTATLAGGTLTLPWFSALPATPNTAAGAGLRNFLREPRVAATATTAASGGRGLIDRLAWMALTRLDASGLTRTQAEAAAGTLAATLASWGVSAATSALLLGASGNLMALTQAEQVEVVEAFEATEWLTLNFSGFPTRFPAPTPTSPAPVFTPPEVAGLMSFAITGIAGSFTFRPGVPLIAPLTIGANGDIDTVLMLPDITFTATVIRFMTLAGWGVIGAVVTGACLVVPGLCHLLLPIAVLLILLANQLTTLDLVTTNVGIGLNVRWVFDATEGKVLPRVSLTFATGTATVTSRFSFPNLVANAFEGVLLAFANQLNAWVPVGGLVLAGAVQEQLTKFGITCPFGSDSEKLRAVEGGAVSVVADHLSLFANCQAEAGLLAMPYASQAASRGDEIAMRLDEAGRSMQRDFDAAVTPADTAAWLGVGYNQNALNQLLFQRWSAGAFRMDWVGPAYDALVQRITVPWQDLLRKGVRAHAWCAVAPRLEFSSESTALGGRTLLAFFDDVRICFEAPPREGNPAEGPPTTLVEMAFNFKTTATLTLQWPAVAELLFDRLKFEPSDLRSWDWVDVSASNTPQPKMTELVALAEDAAMQLLAGVDASACQPVPPTAARPWAAILPGRPETLPALAAVPPAVGSTYLELRATRRALHALPALRSSLLELVDGSGAPTLQLFVGVTRPLTLGTLRGNEGTSLRNTFLGFMGAGTQFP